MTVIHDRNPVAVMLSDGRVRNAYAVHLSNKADETRTFRLADTGPADAEVEIADGGMLVTVPADSTEEARVLLKARSRERQPVEFSVTDERTGRSVTAADMCIPPDGSRQPARRDGARASGSCRRQASVAALENTWPWFRLTLGRTVPPSGSRSELLRVFRQHN